MNLRWKIWKGEKMLRIPVSKATNNEQWYQGLFNLFSKTHLKAAVPDEAMTYTYYHKVDNQYKQITIGTEVTLESGSYLLMFQIPSGKEKEILPEQSITFHVTPEEINNYQLSQALSGIYQILGGDPSFYASVGHGSNTRGDLFYDKIRREIKIVQELVKKMKEDTTAKETTPAEQTNTTTERERIQEEDIINKNASQMGSIGLSIKQIDETLSSLVESFNSYLDNFDAMNQTVLDNVPKLSANVDNLTKVNGKEFQEQKQRSTELDTKLQQVITKLNDISVAKDDPGHNQVVLEELKGIKEQIEKMKNHTTNGIIKKENDTELQKENEGLRKRNEELFSLVKKTEQQRDAVAEEYREYIDYVKTYVKDRFNIVFDED